MELDCNLITRKVDTGGSWVQGQLELYGEFEASWIVKSYPTPKKVVQKL
jgi:hypothetical protein